MNREKLEDRALSKRDHLIVAVDFDKTLFEEGEGGYPNIGEPIDKTINYVKELQERGSKIILWTCRDGADLLSAIKACNNMDLYFDAVNENVDSLVNSDTLSKKVYASIYIDDKCINVEDI
jgi:hydroxymethylpyrimidine pyrophosphatase-like HAD family hydrolase